MPPVRLGAYRLARRLSSGGLAESWEATQEGIEGFSREVVVKRINPEYAAEQHFVERFLAEARLAAGFNHPNIVQILDLGESDGDYYVAMEPVRGKPLAAILERAGRLGRRLPRPAALRIVADTAAALFYAHSGGIAAGRSPPVLHGDVSPQNILVSVDGLVKLVDFGMARAAEDLSQQRTEAIARSYLYASPEQAEGEALSPKSDLFSLGLVLYTLLTGASPYARGDVARAELQAARRAEVPQPSSVVELPKRVDSLVMRALARRPEDRYAGCREFQLALEECIVADGALATSVQVAELLATYFPPGSEPPSTEASDDASGSGPAGLTPSEPVAAVQAATRGSQRRLPKVAVETGGRASQTNLPSAGSMSGRRSSQTSLPGGGATSGRHASQPSRPSAPPDTLTDDALFDRSALARLRESAARLRPVQAAAGQRSDRSADEALAPASRDAASEDRGPETASKAPARARPPPASRRLSTSSTGRPLARTTDTDPDYVLPGAEAVSASTTSDEAVGDWPEPSRSGESAAHARGTRWALWVLVALAVAALAGAVWLVVSREPPTVVAPIKGE